MGFQATGRRLKFAVATGPLVLLTFFVLASPARADEALAWNPAKTRVFAVGLLEWKNAKIWSPFPAAMPNRRDAQLVDFFRKAGVAEQRIVYLRDAAATKAAVAEAFHEFLDASREGELLVFYFAGHGYRNRDTNRSYFATYDAGKKDSSGWPVTSLVNTIENRFNGSNVWLIADCCHSGALYDEVLKHREGGCSYVCLTSAYSHNTSTGAWTFTDSLLQALRGGPNIDDDGDRYIDWAEAARYVECEMAFVEGQKSMFVTTGELTPKARLAAVAGTAKPQAGRHCEALSNGKWYKAEVVEYDAPRDRYFVHYLNWSARYDEWIPSANLRPFRPSTYPKGTKVEAYSGDDEAWYPARVLDSWYGLHLVHYDGYDATWDEWVGPGSVRARK